MRQARRIHINIDDLTEDKIKTAMEVLTLALAEISHDKESNPAECFKIAICPLVGLYGAHRGAILKSGRIFVVAKFRDLVDRLIKDHLDNCDDIVNKHILDNK